MELKLNIYNLEIGIIESKFRRFFIGCTSFSFAVSYGQEQ